MAEAADPAQDVIWSRPSSASAPPYWDPASRGALFGMTRNTGPNELARAALESVASRPATSWRP